VNPCVAELGGDAESVTVAMNPAVPWKFAVPDSNPVEASIVSPVTKREVDETGAIDHVSAPMPFVACNV
jgi:hypothetical protein